MYAAVAEVKLGLSRLSEIMLRPAEVAEHAAPATDC